MSPADTSGVPRYKCLQYGNIKDNSIFEIYQRVKKHILFKILRKVVCDAVCSVVFKI